MQLAEICGKIVYVNQKNKKLFHIYAPTINKKFKGKYEGFLPVKKGDSLLGIAEWDGNEQLFFKIPPYVMIGSDKETIIEALMISLKNIGVLYCEKKANMIFDILVTETISFEFYEFLCLAKGASIDDVKKSYRKLARIYHPDKVSENMKEEATKKFLQIKEAYDTLSDPGRKELYDKNGGKRKPNYEEVLPQLIKFAMHYCWQNMEYDPYTLFSDILDEKQFIKLNRSIYKNFVLRKLYLLGLTNKEIMNAKKNPEELYEILIKNPFTVSSISLEKCEEILIRLGRMPDSEASECGRIVRKISDIMESSSYSCIPVSNIKRYFPNYEERKIKLHDEYGITEDYDSVYLEYPHRVETFMADHIKFLLKTEKLIEIDKMRYTRFDLTDDQREAIKTSLSNNVSIITGAGGTGKSTILKELVFNLECNDIKYRLASFTGKAVNRMREITGEKRSFYVTYDDHFSQR